jgi:hypothetical protein
MPVRQPLIHRRRQQKTRLAINRTEIAHQTCNRAGAESTLKLYPIQPDHAKSDSLLAFSIGRLRRG